ncbi:hypothetical protein CEY12_10290 [Chryseobacterium sp. T16E-39]|uniref:hypothetical protein n=1 Tax=Chryseobacterium sp. T16E-39 TaxID=2015076 RepID=UPI000B5B3982|nr:hypothetical protein [Chryseobacterium sp. T16E-39]ASK30473.1 hypothetical protein CEY12_10290 [Chryseobacterium sp. T16E-39]
MTIFNKEEYTAAIAAWDASSKDYSTIQKLIPPNYVFILSLDQIDWVKRNNKCTDFCSEMGVYKNQLVLILCPLDPSGQKIAVNEYPYSILSVLTTNLTLIETQEYTLVKNAVLSKDLQQVDKTADMYFPVANMPVMEQDKAVAAIELWRDESSTWFYRECDEFKGTRIFKRFYVPAEDLNPSKEGLSYIVCSFGIKFSEIYQRTLVTLIFISFYQDLQNTGSMEVISNTYDWSRPCPPICQL